MKKILLLLAAAAGAACGKPAPQAKPGLAVYEDPGKRFSFQAPADWRVQRRDGRVAFFGPPDGPAPFTASVSVSIRSGGAAAYHDAQAAAGGKILPLVDAFAAGRKAFQFEEFRKELKLHSTRSQELAVKTLLLPLPEGILVVAASANPGGETAADQAFEAVKTSLKLP